MKPRRSHPRYTITLDRDRVEDGPSWYATISKPHVDQHPDAHVTAWTKSEALRIAQRIKTILEEEAP